MPDYAVKVSLADRPAALRVWLRRVLVSGRHDVICSPRSSSRVHGWSRRRVKTCWSCRAVCDVSRLILGQWFSCHEEIIMGCLSCWLDWVQQHFPLLWSIVSSYWSVSGHKLQTMLRVSNITKNFDILNANTTHKGLCMWGKATL